MTVAPTTPAPADGPAPDADALPCPLCGYDLRATADGRCPECGHAFTRAELRAAIERRARIGWYVESPEPAPLSGWRTSLRSLLPLCFWRQLDPALPPRRGRLLGFAAAGVLLPVLIVFLVPFATLASANRGAPAWRRLDPWDTVWRGGVWWPVLIVLVTLPVSTLLTLFVFRNTQRRANVNAWHLVRVAVLCNDHRLLVLPLAWLAYYFAAPVVGLVFPTVTNWYGGFVDGTVEGHVLMIGLLLWPYATYRVVAAHLNYLKLPQPVTTALLVQAVPLLVIVVLAFWV